MTIQISEASYTSNHVKINSDIRKVFTTSAAFGILRQQLVKNIGMKRLKNFLYHFGWKMGANDAKKLMKENTDKEYLIRKGPMLHIENGHIRGMEHKCDVNYNDLGDVESVYGRGIWIDSYEAQEHIQHFGVADEPVCHTLIGYASGFMSTVFGEPVLAKEFECVGKGDPVCRWKVKTKRQWLEEGHDDYFDYENPPIVEELEVTYEQLYKQQQFMLQLEKLQKRLMDEVINGSDLQTISEIIYSIANVPLTVEDRNFQLLASAGLTDEQYIEYKEDLENYLENKKLTKDNWPEWLLRGTIKTDLQERLITPIFVQKEILGYCTFIYDCHSTRDSESDFFILERFASAASLILLNEKTEFESFERMKGTFLEQILDNQLTKNEMIKRGKYTGLDLSKPYYVIILRHKRSGHSIEEEFRFQENIYDFTTQYFSQRKQNVLIGQRDGKIVMLITKDSLGEQSIDLVLEEYHRFLLDKFPLSEFKIGFSNEANDIETANQSYEEALMAVRLPSKKKIVSFQSLGVIGVLMNSDNLSGIRMIAEKELGLLYEHDEEKSGELLKTLYFFLRNGGKLEQTMKDLSLSMSGLRHRIRKIENLLNKDLRDPEVSHQLLLILQLLISLGELKINE